MFWQCVPLSSLCTSSSDENKHRRQQQELEQSWAEVRQAVAGRQEAEQSLQQIQAQLGESKVNLEKLRSELLIQREHSEQGEAAATLSRITVFQPWLTQGKQAERSCSFSEMPFITVSLYSHLWSVCHSSLLSSFAGTVGD